MWDTKKEHDLDAQLHDHRECIEVETDYERGVMDERKRWEEKRCETCKHVAYFSPHDSLECGNSDCSFYGMDVDFTDGCNKHEPKESE